MAHADRPHAGDDPFTEWWERPDCRYSPDGYLLFAGRRASELAAHTGTPAYFYSAERISHNVDRLRHHLATIGRPCRLYYAMKSNRFAPVLIHLRELGVGLDVCSPGEVRHALTCGFAEEDMSFTAGSLSTADYHALAGWPALRVNADSLTAIRRLAEVSPARTIGLRLNPATGLGYRSNPLVRYAGSRPTKFGIYRDRLAEALDLARSSGLQVDGLHCHAGCGFLTPQLDALDEVFTRIGEFLAAAPGVGRLNLGGGLGIPLDAADAPLDLGAWAALVRRHFGHRALRLEFEPGDYLVKDAGVLVTEVTQVEEKSGRVFVGLNAGFNIHLEPAFYRLPLAPVPALRRPGAAQNITLVGNINEALDVWADDVALPPLAERDLLCLLNAGGYGASMSSAHCLRTEMTEHFLPALPGPRDAARPSDESLATSNRRAWDRLYASTDHLVWGTQPVPFLADFADELRAALRAPSRLLDAGTGEGRNLPLLLECGATEVHAIDSSASALQKIPAALRPQVRTRQCLLDATGFPDAHFDAIVIIDVIETLPDAAQVLRELARILKPGGVLLCNIPGLDDGVAGIDMQALSANAFLYRQSYYFQFIERHEAESLLLRAGLEVRRSCRCQWRENEHPGFRQDEHLHVSQIFVAQRPPTPPPA